MKWGHTIVIIICAGALAGLVISLFNQAGPGTEELRQTNHWIALGAAAGGAVAGILIWLLPWPFIEMLWHRQPNDRAIYLMIVINTATLAAAYYYLAPMSRMIYPEIACVAAAAVIYYRNYTVKY